MVNDSNSTYDVVAQITIEFGPQKQVNLQAHKSSGSATNFKLIPTEENYEIPLVDFTNFIKNNFAPEYTSSFPNMPVAANLEINKFEISTAGTLNLKTDFKFSGANSGGWSIFDSFPSFKLKNVGIQATVTNFPAPTLTTATSSGGAVTLTGTNFTAVESVNFYNAGSETPIVATPPTVVVVSSTSITLSALPSGVTATGLQVSVTTVAGESAKMSCTSS